MSVRLNDRDLVAPMAWLSTRERSTASSWRTQRPVLDLAKCTGCMICWKFCPEPTIEPAGEKVRIDLGACKGCGVCAHECPFHAITMVPESD